MLPCLFSSIPSSTIFDFSGSGAPLLDRLSRLVQLQVQALLHHLPVAAMDLRLSPRLHGDPWVPALRAPHAHGAPPPAAAEPASDSGRTEALAGIRLTSDESTGLSRGLGADETAQV